MTFVAGLLAHPLAVGEPGLDWRWLTLAVVGITLAHLAINLMNNLYDTSSGSDSAAYLAPCPRRARPTLELSSREGRTSSRGSS